jgi:RNA polymerase sigma factor (sigma-70 family)
MYLALGSMLYHREDRLSVIPEDVDQWNQRIVRAILPIVRDDEVARDLCQDVWVRYMEHRPDLGENPNIGGWLLTVARNLALNHVQSGKVRFRAAVTVDTIDPTSLEPTPVEVAHRRQEAERIDTVLRGLNPRHAGVIRLCDIDGMSYAEAGAKLNLSESAVTSLLHRARTAFRREYLVALAPPWLRALAATGSVDEVLGEIDPFAPPVHLGDAVERRAHGIFSDLAGRWDRIRTASVPSDLDAAVAERARLASDDNALDVGTGTGVVAMHVAPKVRRVVGIDRSLPMLRVARERVQSSGSRNVLMEFGDLLSLPVRPESIDVAFCSLVLRMVQRPEDAVLNVAQTLRPGGRIVLCDAAQMPGSSEPGLTPSQLSRWLTDAGLSRISIDEVGGKDSTRFVIAVGHRE